MGRDEISMVGGERCLVIGGYANGEGYDGSSVTLRHQRLLGSDRVRVVEGG